MKRKVVRGTRAIFDEVFLEEDGTPLVPYKPDQYPQVSILDPNGEVVTDGLGKLLSEGRYQFDWFVPVDAELNSALAAWTIRWVFITALGNRTIERAAEFDVIDSIDLGPDERAYTYMCSQGESERIFSRYRIDQEEISCTVTAPDGSRLVVAKTAMTRVPLRGEIVYFFDTPPLTAIGDYLVMWRSRQTIVSSTQTGMQMLRVPEWCFNYMAPSMRMFIDKAQKRSGLVQSYSDSDIYEYLRQGLMKINLINPISQWNLGTLPPNMAHFLFVAAAIHGLRAQYITEELRFSFSGQTTTLDSDRSAIYDAILTRLETELKEDLPQAKVGILRSYSITQNANRPYDLGLGSYVFPIQRFQTGGTFNALPLMSTLGLI